MHEFPIFKKELPKLNYMADSRYVPIPPAERGLQTIVAEPFLKVSDDWAQLEGLCFDKKGDLFFTDINNSRVFKLEMSSKKLSVIYQAPENYGCSSVKIHKDGRLFIACGGDWDQKGCLFSIQPDGSDFQMIIPFEKGYVVDDLVFDTDGSLFFTDYKGATGRANGGVYHVSSDMKVITPVIQNLCSPNGIGFTTDRKALWITETSANRLNYAYLTEDRMSVATNCCSVPYYFTGYFGPDSLTVDEEDNVYISMYEQGRVMVFNQNGYPIGQILVPGREQGHILHTEHAQLRPGTDEIYFCSNDAEKGGGSWLFAARGFAKAWLGSFQFNV